MPFNEMAEEAPKYCNKLINLITFNLLSKPATVNCAFCTADQVTALLRAMFSRRDISRCSIKNIHVIFCQQVAASGI
jgi:hypothetical protein